MSDYQTRVRTEYDELSDRHYKLLAFFDTHVFENLPEIERTDLRNQAHHMLGYLAALRNRMSRF